jgi:hypothetical protein
MKNFTATAVKKYCLDAQIRDRYVADMREIKNAIKGENGTCEWIRLVICPRKVNVSNPGRW